MKAHWGPQVTTREQGLERPMSTVPWGERLIRWFLLTGFIAVLVIEAWFLWQLISLP